MQTLIHRIEVQIERLNITDEARKRDTRRRAIWYALAAELGMTPQALARLLATGESEAK